MSAHRTGRLCVCVNAVPLRLHVGKPVRDAEKGTHQVEAQRPDAQVSPSICNNTCFKGMKGAVFFQACFEINDRRMSLAVCIKNFFLADHDLNGSACFLGEKGCAIIHIKHLVLAAETASNVRLHDTNAA